MTLWAGWNSPSGAGESVGHRVLDCGVCMSKTECEHSLPCRSFQVPAPSSRPTWTPSKFSVEWKKKLRVDLMATEAHLVSIEWGNSLVICSTYVDATASSQSSEFVRHYDVGVWYVDTYSASKDLCIQPWQVLPWHCYRYNVAAVTPYLPNDPVPISQKCLLINMER